MVNPPNKTALAPKLKVTLSSSLRDLNISDTKTYPGRKRETRINKAEPIYLDISITAVKMPVHNPYQVFLA